MNVLITGSSGYLGRLCAKRLYTAGAAVHEFDLPADVLDREALSCAASAGADQCLHLAAHKHAPYGEEQPADVAEVNILGTRNVVEAFGPNVVLASTCKAADPMTAYGASKLIAERIVLNAGGRVVRLVNVWGSSGSVADIWSQIPPEEPLPVVDECKRMWMSADEAIKLLTYALGWPCGRYAPNTVGTVTMTGLAARTHPKRAVTLIAPRRGDRLTERLVAEYEWTEPWQAEAVRILHPADVTAKTAEPV